MYGYRSTRRKTLKAQERHFFLLKTRLHWKLLVKYIVLQVAAKNTSFITYNWNFSLVYCNILLVTHSWKRHRLVASCQFYRLVATCQQIATSLSISSSCNKSVKIRLVENCHLQTCYNLLNKLQACWNNQLATSLFTTCKRLVINKLSPAMQTHPSITTCCNKLLQDVNRLVTTCTFLVV